MGETTTELTWGGLLRAMGTWLKENLPRALLMSALSFAFGWLVNFFVMAFRWDGFRAPTGQSDYITAENSLLMGTLFWAALASFLFAIISYGFRVGWGQLLRELFGLPQRMATMFRGEERNRSLTSLAWALMLGLLLSLVISPGVAALTAGFFLVFAATPLGVLLSGLLRRLWIQLVARFAPHKGEPSGGEVGSAAVTAVGMLIGFVVAVAVDVLVLKLLALVMAGLAAYYFANEDELGPSGGTAVLLLMAAAVGLYELFDVGVAFADDGGWSECGNCNVLDYVRSTGAAEVVSRSTVAGGASAVGAPVGAAVGDVLGSMGGGGGGTGGTGGTGGPGGGGGSGDPGVTTASAGPAGPAAAADPAPSPGGDSSDVLGAIGGGEGGAPTGPGTEGGTTGDAGGAGGSGGSGGVRTASGEDVAPAPGPSDTGTGAGGAGGGRSGGRTGDSGDSGDVLGAIGGGEGGGATPSGTEAGPADAPPGDADGPGGPEADAVGQRPRRSPEQPPLDPDGPEPTDTQGQPGGTAPPPPDQEQ